MKCQKEVFILILVCVFVNLFIKNSMFNNLSVNKL